MDKPTTTAVIGTILGIAADEQFDLVVMNSHAPGLRDQALDAHATEVVRQAGCSVLVVR